MRHRLFHAIVIAGASMACGGGEESSSTTDAGTDANLVDADKADSGAVDSNVVDSGGADTTSADTTPTVDATPDVCDGGCGSSCFPCIK